MPQLAQEAVTILHSDYKTLTDFAVDIKALEEIITIIVTSYHDYYYNGIAKMW